MARTRMSSEVVGPRTTLHSVAAQVGPEDLRRMVLDALVRGDPRLAVVPEREFSVEFEWDPVRGPTAHVTALHTVEVEDA